MTSLACYSTWNKRVWSIISIWQEIRNFDGCPQGALSFWRDWMEKFSQPLFPHRKLLVVGYRYATVSSDSNTFVLFFFARWLILRSTGKDQKIFFLKTFLGINWHFYCKCPLRLVRRKPPRSTWCLRTGAGRVSESEVSLRSDRRTERRSRRRWWIP